MHRVLKDRSIYILSAARTPVGAFDGILSPYSATTLGSAAIRAALLRAGVDGSCVDEVFMGNVVTGGLGQAPAKHASVGGGIPQTVPATLVNSVCSSSVTSVIAGVNAILAGASQLVVAGGMESRTNAPYLVGPKLPDGSRLPGKVKGQEFVLKQPKTPEAAMELLKQIDLAKIREANIYDGLVCPFDPTKLMKDYAEAYARQHNWDAELVNQYADESHRKASEAQRKGFLDEEITPVEPGGATKDELTDPERLKQLREWSNVVCSPYNCPSLGDNAAAVVLADAQRVKQLGVTPMARLAGYARVDCAPEDFVNAPAQAVEELRVAMKSAGMETEWPVMEMNESFGLQLVLYDKLWPGVTVNIHGGAVAFRHPLGSAGVRILVTLLYAMKRYGVTSAVTAVCFGGGGAVALALETP